MGLAALVVVLGIGAVALMDDDAVKEQVPVAASPEPSPEDNTQASPVGSWSGKHEWAWNTEEPYIETIKLRLDPCVAGGDDCGVVTWTEAGEMQCRMWIRYMAMEDGRFLYMGTVDTDHSKAFCRVERVALRPVGGGRVEYDQMSPWFGSEFKLILRPTD
jgi:hypothetical protein